MEEELLRHPVRPPDDGSFGVRSCTVDLGPGVRSGVWDGVMVDCNGLTVDNGLLAADGGRLCVNLLVNM